MQEWKDKFVKVVNDPYLGYRYLFDRAISPYILRLKYRNIDIDPIKPIWINPEEIQQCVIGGKSVESDFHADVYERFRPRDRKWPRGEPVRWGAVIGGDWDKKSIPVEELLIFKGLYQHFIDGVKWEETTLLKQHIERLEHGKSTLGCKNVSELYKNYNRIDLLYSSIKNKGYKSQEELGNRWQPHREIIVNISSDGELLFNGQGRHRLAIAKILELDRIPVTVLVRHSAIIRPP